MSHQERNSVRAAYIHRAEHLDARKAMMQWWSDYLDVSREGYVAPYIMRGGIRRPDPATASFIENGKAVSGCPGAAFCIERFWLRFSGYSSENARIYMARINSGALLSTHH
ncbi:integrase [Salmonella enterica subsp. enterica]|nr:integrase [Salmonella enterica subsp. enterica]